MAPNSLLRIPTVQICTVVPQYFPLTVSCAWSMAVIVLFTGKGGSRQWRTSQHKNGITGPYKETETGKELKNKCSFHSFVKIPSCKVAHPHNEIYKVSPTWFRTAVWQTWMADDKLYWFLGSPLTLLFGDYPLAERLKYPTGFHCHTRHFSILSTLGPK